MAEVDTSVEWMCGFCCYVYVAQSGDPKGKIQPEHLLRNYQMTGYVLSVE